MSLVSSSSAAAANQSAAAASAASHPMAAIILKSTPLSASTAPGSGAESAEIAESDSVLCRPLSPLLRSIRAGVLSSMADESELRLRLSAAEQREFDMRAERDAANQRAECSDALARQRKEEADMVRSEVDASVERERHYASEAESWRSQLLACRAEADSRLRECQAHFDQQLASQQQQLTSKAGRERRQQSERLAASERARTAAEEAAETERRARRAAEEAAAVAKQSAGDRQMEAAGAAGGRETSELRRQLAASQESQLRFQALYRQIERDKDAVQKKLDRTMRFIQQGKQSAQWLLSEQQHQQKQQHINQQRQQQKPSSQQRVEGNRERERAKQGDEAKQEGVTSR